MLRVSGPNQQHFQRSEEDRILEIIKGPEEASQIQELRLAVNCIQNNVPANFLAMMPNSQENPDAL